MTECFVLVAYDLSQLAVYLLQQQKTGISSQHKWDKLSEPLSLAGFRARSWTDLLPPSHWCQMNDERLDMKTTTTRHFIALFFLSSMTSQRSGQEHTVMCREVCDLIVYISAKSPKVSVTFFILYARKVTATVLSQSWFHEVIRCANGQIDSVTSVDAY